jgi:hypothetical protein
MWAPGRFAAVARMCASLFAVSMSVTVGRPRFCQGWGVVVVYDDGSTLVVRHRDRAIQTRLSHSLSHHITLHCVRLV